MLTQVPRDALGLAVVRNLSEADAKLGKLLAALGTPLPGPQAMLKSIAGIDAGLDARRDLLVVLLPPQDGAPPGHRGDGVVGGGPRQFHLALWLPVSDYDALVRSLEGDPERRIAAVTIAGEDLLVARHHDWAVVMDPDQRDRLEQLRTQAESPPRQLATWAAWVETNDAAVVVLPSGMRTLWTLAASEQKQSAGETLPRAEVRRADDAAAPRDGWPAALYSIRTLIAEAPEFARWAAEAESAACGLRLDEDGNLVLGARVMLPVGELPGTNDVRTRPSKQAPPRLYEAGRFVLTGSGQVSPRWAVPAVAPYVRTVVDDLATHYGNKLDDGAVARFRQAVEQAVGKVNAFSVLTRPGEPPEGVFTNNFLAVRVEAAAKFLEHSGEAMRLWNAMIDKAQGAVRLVFNSKPITIAKCQGTEYSIDMAAAVGAPAIPELRTSMEKLFGPGGEFRLQFVAVDDETVLLAAATEAQVAGVLEVMSRAAAGTEEPNELRESARLLSKSNAWQLYLSPHGYTDWLSRQMDAVLGPVIGGPVVPDFAPSPPLGMAGGVDGQTAWVEVVVPANTVRGAGQYLGR